MWVQSIFFRSLDISVAFSKSLCVFLWFFLAWIWVLEHQCAKAASLEHSTGVRWQLFLNSLCLTGTSLSLRDLVSCVNQRTREGIPPHFAQIHTISVRYWSLTAGGIPEGIYRGLCPPTVHRIVWGWLLPILLLLCLLRTVTQFHNDFAVQSYWFLYWNLFFPKSLV